MVREFTSAFICKRVDAFTLETIDGFTIVIDGPVNQNRSKLNGFSVEVGLCMVLTFNTYLLILYFIYIYFSFSSPSLTCSLVRVLILENLLNQTKKEIMHSVEKFQIKSCTYHYI